MDTMTPDPVALEIRHAVPGRARLRPARPMDAGALKALGDAVSMVPGLTRVLVRPNTGSLILQFAGPPEALFTAITAQGIATIRPAAPPPPIGQVAQLGLIRADMVLKDGTRNTLDLNSTMALILLIAAMVQIGRGQIAGPATTLAMAALNMLDRGRSN